MEDLGEDKNTQVDEATTSQGPKTPDGAHLKELPGWEPLPDPSRALTILAIWSAPYYPRPTAAVASPVPTLWKTRAKYDCCTPSTVTNSPPGAPSL
ncbi:MAG TPA: hypothetical protein VIU15_23025 [Streptomyces sp.]